ncbi:MAG: glycosyltransferase family A protein [Tepidisphaeraceae bacterium]
MIIPTFNRRELLRRTVQTVMSQQDAEAEIIVVDDGSTDGTMEMLGTLAPRVQMLCQSNHGPGAARNLGMTHAKGDYIAFLDSDDLWFPWTLNTYQRVIERHGRPAFVAGCPMKFGVEAQLADAGQGEIRVESFADYFASGDEWRWFGASSFVIRREVLAAEGGFTFNFNHGEDADLAMRLGVAPGFVQIKSPVTFGYRNHPGTLTDAMDERYRAVGGWIDRERGGDYPGGRGRRAERRRILTRHIRGSTVSLLDAGRVGSAWQIYCRTWTWNLRQRRIRYLLGLPAKALVRMMVQRGSGPQITGPP